MMLHHTLWTDMLWKGKQCQCDGSSAGRSSLIHIIAKGCSGWKLRTVSYLKEWWCIDTGCPGRSEGHCPWRCLRTVGMWHWGTQLAWWDGYGLDQVTTEIFFPTFLILLKVFLWGLQYVQMSGQYQKAAFIITSLRKLLSIWMLVLCFCVKQNLSVPVVAFLV